MTLKTRDIVRLVAASLILCGIAFAGAAAEEKSERKDKQGSPALASTEAEWKAMMQSKRTDIIRSLEDWKAYVGKTTKEAGHPLAAVDKATVKTFTDRLVFRNGGLAGASYEMLEGKLTEKQFDTLWAAFGMSPKLLMDYKGSWCSSRATCSARTGSICTSNCHN